ncbi:FUSC family protein [Ancylobacter lacus]|uniref:FUSC family protein n=1 Tax=Ancylobacter lacus TaxID=2579970 RepID=UPI001BD144C6|nr:FUSC family protein [Ancylobacter lacus]
MTDIDRQALATALGVLAAVHIALVLGLQQPYWAALSVLIISNVDRTALFTKGVLRVAGTLFGVGAGYVVAMRVEGLPVIQAVLLMMAAGLGTYARQRSAYAYAWFYGALSFMLVLLSSMTEPAQLYDFMVYRCSEIVIGVVAATVANWALGPRPGELPAGVAAAPSAVTPEEAARHALAASVGALCIVLAWVEFDLPQLIQVLISSLIVVDINVAATRHRGFQRIAGCLIGGAAGLSVIVIDAVDQLWWTVMLFVGVLLCARVHLGRTPYAYVGTQAAIAFLVTLVDVGPPGSIMPPLDRLVGIVLGVSLMMLVVWALNPPRPLPAAAGPAG